MCDKDFHTLYPTSLLRVKTTTARLMVMTREVNKKTGWEALSQVRMPPQNIEAEISVLGSLLLDGTVFDHVTDTLSTKDFYKVEHQIIFDAIISLSTHHRPIDILSVASTLRENGKFEEIGGNTYLTNLVSSVPSASNAKYYAEIVRKKKILRDLISVSYEISQ